MVAIMFRVRHVLSALLAALTLALSATTPARPAPAAVQGGGAMRP